ncbi:hypothetical protein XENOCAPTIV_028330 [Xenoophorus captivus]|uniref:Phosphatidylinositol-3-phosphate phosphatase n=1 Tax=Xenoophorus captivus TaxID=1517983 RepID=A0ABV0SBW7_9TELE
MSTGTLLFAAFRVTLVSLFFPTRSFAQVCPLVCFFPSDSSLTGGSGCDDSTVPQKLLILDARSYTAAVANRAKGGGCECEGYWLSALESTRWLQHLSVMLKAATLVCGAVEREGRPVLVHCSDGWDRTPQIVALAKVLLDPYYRTLEVLVETEWLDYGHKFGDRCGHQENMDDVSEQCPVFLQWLDCVHQLLKQFPCLFEFNEAFLVGGCPTLLPACFTMKSQPLQMMQFSVDESVELYLPPCVAGDELTSRSLDRLPKTRSMDNLLSALDNGLPLTRTSSDPNLNKHCQEGRSAPEPSGAVEDTSADSSGEDLPDGTEEVHSADHGLDNSGPGAECSEEPCLTTQPLPSLPLPPVSVGMNDSPTHSHNAFSTPVLHQASPQITNLPLPSPPLETESPSRTAEPSSPTHKSEPCLPLPCKNTQPATNTFTLLSNGHVDGEASGPPQSSTLLTLKQRAGSMGDSTETLTDEGDLPPASPSPLPQHLAQSDFSDEDQPQKEEENLRTDLVKGRGRTLTDTAAAVDCAQVPPRHLTSQGQLSDLPLLGLPWDSVQGLVQSTCSHSAVIRALHPSNYQSRQLAGKLLRSQGFAAASGSQCCRREALCCSSGSLQAGWLAAARSSSYNGLCGPAFNSYSLAVHQLLPASYSSLSASSSPPPPQTPAYLDDDGLPVPLDAVQQRLRQIEAGYKQEVEVLRQQVRQLQMRLESKQLSSPPSEPDIDYEDDIVSCFFNLLNFFQTTNYVLSLCRFRKYLPPCFLNMFCYCVPY